MTKILITNTNCSWNKGSVAQVVGTVKTSKRLIAEPNFLYWS
ncbi:hypothetical protein HNR54_000135 [Methanothermobacter sp. DSM 3267]